MISLKAMLVIYGLYTLFSLQNSSTHGVESCRDWSKIVKDNILRVSFLLFLHCFWWFRENHHKPFGITSLYHDAPGPQMYRDETCTKTKYRLRQTTSHSTLLIGRQGNVSRQNSTKRFSWQTSSISISIVEKHSDIYNTF